MPDLLPERTADLRLRHTSGAAIRRHAGASPRKTSGLLSTAKPRLLVVPHLYTDTIRVREIELARRLTRHFEVHCLKWNDAFFVRSDWWLKARLQRVSTGVKSLFTRRNVTRGDDGIAYVEIPMVQALVLKNLVGGRLAVDLAQKCNTRVLMDVTHKLGITHLLIASGHFHVPQANGIQLFCDIVDWFDERKVPGWALKKTEVAVKEMAREATRIFAVSSLLSERLQLTYGLRTSPIPNGADVVALRSVPAGKIAAVRRRWGLEGRFVMGYIGNHESFTGVDFVIRVHQRLLKTMPDAVLFIVGPAGYWKSRLKNSPRENVVFTGAVSPSEISAYFNAVDIGMLAQTPHSGTNYAFQIKMVEYAASRKFTISTPLELWKKLAWPSVSLVELKEDLWVQAIHQMRARSWNPEWDSLVDPYDWQVIADDMAAGILNAPAGVRP